ncbi:MULTISPECIES: bifunctional diguanylate cyclase/phosphodiesterase [unclassified Paracoccus (in: a-proteobacteria)]|uniref:putative bifunctional diguanylate cyclase/phosphodiesterase n=1 Tax=unclassified Paracoccus (in: a-proteobacteria) TaxID=2688777 RepID=UPI0015FF8636|nr:MULTISPECIES: sensor domain-containing phosphodiesterase [unclassified Paracoccus (in: a-proteobacteria)]MBB1491160.1 sensor domain-containing phosphodiesterase [Paracoccus sp. MC1854]MBB1497025.1 sensor domain-containing phosphodiesterase [Paracoccus sp. MC1862]QQO44570.1 sensor domain-containing phosphodiesterase [Paracoccus sp. MC1862]
MVDWHDDGFLGDDTASATPEEILQRSCERYSAALRAGALVLWRADLSGRIIAAKGWQALTGLPDHSALDRAAIARFHPEDRARLDFRGREIGSSVLAEGRVLDAQGRWRWMRGRGVLIPERPGYPAEWVGTLEDMHEERLALERARYLAERDALTGLGNRRSLYDHLHRLSDKNASATVALIDVDRFKAINDIHGHHVGDRFLVRLARALVASAPPHAVCARMGGDEFCVVLADEAEAQALFARLSATCAAGFDVGSLRCPTGISAGIADADWTAPNPVSTVLRRADLALYHAKSQPGTAVRFEAAMQDESDARQLLLHAIGSACRNNELFLEYQPIVSLDSAQAFAFEALLRWQHPQFGRVEPSTFVRLAEQNGMISELGRWVLDRACADLLRVPGDVRLNVNVSARQLAEPGFADAAAAIVGAHGVDPRRLTLELTESVSASAVASGTEVESLRRHGFRLVLDDFGTEYAALSHVSSGRFDGIKLSRDFIADCCTSDRAWLVLRHVVNLCDDLGLTVVAEGIETDAELESLRAAGVRLVQGYYFDRPRRLSDLYGNRPAVA